MDKNNIVPEWITREPHKDDVFVFYPKWDVRDDKKKNLYKTSV
jgi:hypothetical protein